MAMGRRKGVFQRSQFCLVIGYIHWVLRSCQGANMMIAVDRLSPRILETTTVKAVCYSGGLSFPG